MTIPRGALSLCPAQLPFKGSKSTQLATNSSRRVDLSTHTKEPFFQRAPQPVPDEPAPSEAAPADVP